MWALITPPPTPSHPKSVQELLITHHDQKVRKDQRYLWRAKLTSLSANSWRNGPNNLKTLITNPFYGDDTVVSLWKLTTRFTLRVVSVKRSLSRSTTPTARPSTRVPLARFPWQPCPSTLHYWSITCRRSRPFRVERTATPCLPPCPGRESGSGRESGLRAARGMKVTAERGARANWCSWRTDVALTDGHRRRMEDEL